MKIVLINPPQILQKQFGRPYVFQPLGLLYIAAVLEKKHSVQIIDAPLEKWRELKEEGDFYFLGLSFAEIKKRVKDLRPEVVGITIPFSINVDSALRVASVVKSVDKNIIVVVGGPHPTIRPMETLASPDIDFVIVGEGEETVQELFQKIEEKSFDGLSKVKGIGYKKNGQIFLNDRRPPIQNLDVIPFPARHLVSMGDYFESMGVKRAARKIYIFDDKWTSVFTSRGCPYKCCFCSISLTMGRQFRPRSPENVIDEIKYLYKEYGIKHINFEDDNLTLDKKRAEKIFDLIIENKLNITWSTPNGIRIENIDEEMVKKMKESGCKRVFVAPESGVQRVVTKIINKNVDLKKIEQAVVLFRKHGIIVDGSFVIGLIGETKLDILKTIFFALKLKRLGMDTAGIHIAAPYYGTKFYEDARKKGYLKEDIDASMLSPRESLLNTPEWSGRQLKFLHGFARWLVNYDTKGKIMFLLPTFLQVLASRIKRLFLRVVKRENKSKKF